MKITEKYALAFKRAFYDDIKKDENMNIFKISHNWHQLKGKWDLETVFKRAEHLGVLNSRDKQKIINQEIKWVEDYNNRWNENEWDITEYLETEYGFIIRFIECRETTAKEFWDRINKR